MAIGISTSISLHDGISNVANRMANSVDNIVYAFNRADAASEKSISPKHINDATHAQDKLTQSVRETESAFDNLANSIIGMVGAYFSVQAVMGTIKNAIEYASDLAEVQNVVNVTFEESAETINSWAQTTLDAFGLSELSAKRYAGTMGAMLKSMGLTGDAVDEMSVNMSQLAGDMASFYNLDTDEAFNKIRSGISGETEPLKQLGINMSVANLNAYAMAQGLELTYDKMDAGSQALLRYNYLLDVTKDAQGDFSRTQDSYANQVRLLQGSWEAFTGTLAQNLLPTLSTVIGALNAFIGFLQEHEQVVGDIISAIGLFIGIVGGVIVVTKLWAGAQMLLNAAMSPVIMWAALFAVVAAGVMYFLKSVVRMTDGVSTCFGVITGGVNVVIQYFINMWHTQENIAKNIAIAFQNAWIGAQSGLASFISAVLTGIVKIGEALSKLPFVEFDMSGLSSAADSWAQKANTLASNKKEYNSDWNAFNEGWAGDAFKTGAAWGDGVVENIKAKFTGGTGMDASDLYNFGSAGLDQVQAIDDIKNKTGGVEKNTQKSLDVSEENLKYLRDIAEQEVINRFTTAEITIQQTNNNNVSSETDIDGMIYNFNEGLTQAMQAAVEGA